MTLRKADPTGMKIYLELTEERRECKDSNRQEKSFKEVCSLASKEMENREGYKVNSGSFFFFPQRGDTSTCYYAAKNDQFAKKKYINIAWGKKINH